MGRVMVEWKRRLMENVSSKSLNSWDPPPPIFAQTVLITHTPLLSLHPAVPLHPCDSYHQVGPQPANLSTSASLKAGSPTYLEHEQCIFFCVCAMKHKCVFMISEAALQITNMLMLLRGSVVLIYLFFHNYTYIQSKIQLGMMNISSRNACL